MLEAVSSDDYMLTLHDSISVGMADGRAQLTRKPSFDKNSQIQRVMLKISKNFGDYTISDESIISIGKPRKDREYGGVIELIYALLIDFSMSFAEMINNSKNPVMV